MHQIKHEQIWCVEIDAHLTTLNMRLFDYTKLKTAFFWTHAENCSGSDSARAIPNRAHGWLNERRQ